MVLEVRNKNKNSTKVQHGCILQIKIQGENTTKRLKNSEYKIKNIIFIMMIKKHDD